MDTRTGFILLWRSPHTLKQMKREKGTPVSFYDWARRFKKNKNIFSRANIGQATAGTDRLCLQELHYVGNSMGGVFELSSWLLFLPLLIDEYSLSFLDLCFHLRQAEAKSSPVSEESTLKWVRALNIDGSTAAGTWCHFHRLRLPMRGSGARAPGTMNEPKITGLFNSSPSLAPLPTQTQMRLSNSFKMKLRGQFAKQHTKNTRTLAKVNLPCNCP